MKEIQKKNRYLSFWFCLLSNNNKNKKGETVTKREGIINCGKFVKLSSEIAKERFISATFNNWIIPPIDIVKKRKDKPPTINVK